MNNGYQYRRCIAAIVGVPLLLVSACGDSVGPEPVNETEAVVVINSTELSLTVIPVEDGVGAYTIGVSPEGSPVSVAARGDVAVVPLGTYPFAAVVNLRDRTVPYMVALPDGSGATGAAFLNDSIALVGNPGLNSVSPINVRRGTAGTAIPVGVYPQAIVADRGKAYVLNGNLVNWVPAGPGSISVIDGSLNVVDTIELSGTNSATAHGDPAGRLYVVHSGTWGAGDGSISVVDPALGEEIEYYSGFGDFPGSIAATLSRVVVGIYAEGILEWNPASQEFVHGPDAPITAGQLPPVAGLGFDSQDRLFAVSPGNCDAPGVAYRLTASGDVDLEVPTGICPFALAFTKWTGD